MANIYLARREGPGDFERHVALKVLNHTPETDPEACAMFLDEARVVALLNHQNIASVLDVDVTPDGRHYLAMEYVHGADLRELLAAAANAGRTLPFETSLAVVMAAAGGLDHAHRRCTPDGHPLELVHRDVSLSNIMVGHDGGVKVVDFGIATTRLATIHTLPGIVRGKASYMSPEQCLGNRVDLRTDVFALGIVLYELTTGARCFAGKSDFDRMLAVVRGEYICPHDIIGNFPLDLERVIRRALAVDANQRYESAAALIDAIEQVRIAHGWRAGATAIAPVMRELFGQVPEPWAISDEPTAPSLPAIAASPTQHRIARGTPAPKVYGQLARGSEVDIGRQLGGWAPVPAPSQADDDDEPTRGRRAIKRPPSSPIVSG
jgi:serine/threonine protein kinase